MDDVMGPTVEGSTGTGAAGAVPVSGNAEKNSLAICARTRESSTLPDRNSGKPLDRSVTGTPLGSLVLIVLSNLDIIEHRDGVVGQNRN